MGTSATVFLPVEAIATNPVVRKYVIYPEFPIPPTRMTLVFQLARFALQQNK
jgi:hypothetical protein